jgi:hypothetical protein
MIGLLTTPTRSGAAVDAGIGGVAGGSRRRVAMDNARQTAVRKPCLRLNHSV